MSPLERQCNSRHPQLPVFSNKTKVRLERTKRDYVKYHQNVLDRSGFVGDMFRNYSKGSVAETEKHIHEKKHDEQAMVEEAAV